MSYAIRMCDLASITLQVVNLIQCTFRTGTGIFKKLHYLMGVLKYNNENLTYLRLN